MINKIFISYSSANEDVAHNICEFMENSGKSCFFAPRDIQPGANYAEKLVEAIDESAALVENGDIGSVFILSEDELKWLDDARISVFVGISEEALTLPICKFYENNELYGIYYNTYEWWLRDAVEGRTSTCKVVYKENVNVYENLEDMKDKYKEHPYIFEKEAGCDCFGVRPAVKVDLTKLK